MRVVAVGNPSDRMAKDFDRRFGHVLVVVRGARLAEVLQFPRLRLSSLHVRLLLDSGEVAELLKSRIGARSAAEEDRIFGSRILRHDAFDVGVTQSRNSRISLRPRFSMETPPPHCPHFLMVVWYSSRVPRAGLPARRYISAAVSKVVGILGSPASSALAPMPNPHRRWRPVAHHAVSDLPVAKILLVPLFLFYPV